MHKMLVFGGILNRRNHTQDQQQIEQYEIPEIDLVIVDLYPFEETLASGASEADIIEKIDIGGISLIRAAAKNYQDVLIVASKDDYDECHAILENNDCQTSLEQRKRFAAKAFNTSSHYDTAIFNYFNQEQQIPVFKGSVQQSSVLRYGENPHQQGVFYGDLDAMFEKLNGKELSYNNLVDVDAAVELIREFTEPTFAVLKHNNACGIASRATLKQAWIDALACDPISAFGGVLICNRTVELDTAQEIHSLFCEVLIAPNFTEDAIKLLSEKKNRILLKQKPVSLPKKQFKTFKKNIFLFTFNKSANKLCARWKYRFKL